MPESACEPGCAATPLGAHVHPSLTATHLQRALLVRHGRQRAHAPRLHVAPAGTRCVTLAGQGVPLDAWPSPRSPPRPPGPQGLNPKTQVFFSLAPQAVLLWLSRTHGTPPTPRQGFLTRSTWPRRSRRPAWARAPLRSAHQRFFKLMLMASKVPTCAEVRGTTARVLPPCIPAGGVIERVRADTCSCWFDSRG